VLKTYGAAPYAAALKKLESQIKEKQTSVNEKIGKFSTQSFEAFVAQTNAIISYRRQGNPYQL
jgi:hypothetical protein